jgi:hypothetical protein
MGASIATIVVLLCSAFVDTSESSTIDKCTNDPNYRFKNKKKEIASGFGIREGGGIVTATNTKRS